MRARGPRSPVGGGVAQAPCERKPRRQDGRVPHAGGGARLLARRRAPHHERGWRAPEHRPQR
eukprot:1806727-Heterocapsa_arctica.AAC.1